MWVGHGHAVGEDLLGFGDDFGEWSGSRVRYCLSADYRCFLGREELENGC